MKPQIDRTRPIPGTRIFDAEQSTAATEAEKALVRARDFTTLGETGGNTCFMMKLSACTGHGLYHIGAQILEDA